MPPDGCTSGDIPNHHLDGWHDNLIDVVAKRMDPRYKGMTPWRTLCRALCWRTSPGEHSRRDIIEMMVVVQATGESTYLVFLCIVHPSPMDSSY